MKTRKLSDLTTNEIIDCIDSMDRDIQRNGKSTFYHSMGLIFISDMLKEVKRRLRQKK